MGDNINTIYVVSYFFVFKRFYSSNSSNGILIQECPARLFLLFFRRNRLCFFWLGGLGDSLLMGGALGFVAASKFLLSSKNASYDAALSKRYFSRFSLLRCSAACFSIAACLKSRYESKGHIIMGKLVKCKEFAVMSLLSTSDFANLAFSLLRILCSSRSSK